MFFPADGVAGSGSRPKAEGEIPELGRQHCVRSMRKSIGWTKMAHMISSTTSVDTEVNSSVELMARVLNAEVSADALQRSIMAICTIPPEERHNTRARVDHLVALFATNRSQGVIWMIAAIIWRLQALGRIAERQEFRCWARRMNYPAGIDPDILTVAASEPLVIVDNEPRFDPDRFFRRLLVLVKDCGHC
jgi:hypothetical protein